ncbi:kinase-like domain-containing protein [Syncephalis pseudoplumigaleata]|uniref:Kinase-like domain-containing protein n=1 Tax=Syncephalis pseudoplumigaleata TaxID=1712513 RepID=A0A4P9YW13_9FUNG|nr:kinase-like domain-containing protein [Syncephalis pseudoplumigaleata]|eukprot:RKP23441.1 kinase-like domain-containing protein [Syncephalis pseudoplumigaleata]
MSALCYGCLVTLRDFPVATKLPDGMQQAADADTPSGSTSAVPLPAYVEQAAHGRKFTDFLGEALETPGILGQEKAQVDSVLSHDDGVIVGKGKWDGEDAIIKCANYKIHSTTIEYEMGACVMLQDAAQYFKGSNDDGQQFVADYKDRFEAKLAAPLPKHYCFVTSYDGDKTLGEYIRPMDAPQRLEAAVLFADQLLRGITYLHRIGLVHRDIKLENVVIKEGKPPKATIIDFDLAKGIRLNHAKESSMRNQLPSGSLKYMSPELLRDKARDLRKSDMWALGVLIFEVLHKQSPFLVAYLRAAVSNNLNIYRNHIIQLLTKPMRLPMPASLDDYFAVQKKTFELVTYEIYTMMIPREKDRPTPQTYREWKRALPKLTVNDYKTKWHVHIDYQFK